MADEKKLTATPYLDYLPDEYSPEEKADGASWPLGAGFYEFGFEVDGAKFDVMRVKGGEVQKRLDAAKAAKEEADAKPASK